MDSEKITKNNSDEGENSWEKMAAEAPAFNSRPEHGTRGRQIQKAEKMLEKAATPALNEKQSSVVEHRSDYQPEQWGIFESIIEDDKKEQFREEMQKLDSETANYLMTLPRNISIIFGYNGESYNLWEETRTNIVETALAGKYSETETCIENGEIHRYSEYGLRTKGKLSELDKYGLKPAPEIAATFDQKLNSFLNSIEEEADREKFMENFQKLDRKTQEFLLNFPDNANNLLPSLGEARSIVYKVRPKIIERTIKGEFTPGAEPDERIEYHNLALDGDNKLSPAYLEFNLESFPDLTSELTSTPNKPKHEHGIRGRQMLKAENFPNHGEAQKKKNRMYFDMYKGKIPLVLPEEQPKEPAPTLEPKEYYIAHESTPIPEPTLDTDESREESRQNYELDDDDYYEANLETMDERTHNYFIALEQNMEVLLGAEDNTENDELYDSVIGGIREAVASGGLYEAYLDKKGFLRLGKTANEYRGYDETNDDAPFEKRAEQFTTVEKTGDVYQDNLNTIGSRARTYLERFAFNIYRILEVCDRENLAKTAVDKMNQAIKDGKLNGAKLFNNGLIFVPDEHNRGLIQGE